MRKLLDVLVIGLATSALLLACDDSGGGDDGPEPDMGGAAGEGGGAGGQGGDGAAGGGVGGQGGDGAAGGGVGGQGGDGAAGGGVGGQGGDGGTPAGDTDPAGPVNEWGPSGRVNSLDIPAGPAAGTEAGCDLVGTGQGSGLGTLAALVEGGLASLVSPDPMTGEIQFILLGQLKGFEEGQTGNAVGEATMNLFIGDQGEGDTFTIDPDSFVGGDPANGPLITFPGTSVRNSAILTQNQEVSLELPIVPGIPLVVRLSDARFKSDLRMEPNGFSAQNGTLAGYFTKDAILELIEGLLEFCGANPDNELCGTISAVIPLDSEPEEAYGLLSAFIPPDVSFQNGQASECAPGACDAVSVCLLVEMQAQVIAGVSAAND